jgi:tetratricopeptide (TPR) repeat protein
MKHPLSILPILFCLFVYSESVAQENQTYTGPYEQGEAAYQFTENELHEKVMNGPFRYAYKTTLSDRPAEHDVLITGAFKDNKKHLAWAVTVKASDGQGQSETVIGSYMDGQKSALWTHRLTDDATGMDMKTVSASFLKNRFRGPFKYTYLNEASDGLKKLQIQGSFDAAGYLNGTWIIRYTDGAGAEHLDSMEYRHGVLGFRHHINLGMPKVMDAYDELAFVEDFFRNMHKVDSSAELNGKKFGIRRTRVNHRFLMPVLGAWGDLQSNEPSNGYDGALPTVLFKQGETASPHLLFIAAELIPWAETPQGKRELEAQLALQRAYDQKIKVADVQFKQENWQQALPLYREALAIIPDEYPRTQIILVEEKIRIQAEIDRLFTLVQSKESLWKGNEKMLSSEEYFGKKKHLYEASVLALDHQKKNLLSEYRDIRTIISQEALDKLTLLNLSEYLEALESVVATQEKIKALVKTEDTKELEKELKKADDPAVLLEMIRGAQS